MFYVLSKILDVLLSPLTWGLVLVFLGAPLTRRAARKKRARPLLTVLGLGTLLVFSSEPVANALFGHLEAMAERTVDPSAHYDAVILLGGVVDDRAMSKSGRVSLNDNVERLLETRELMVSGHADYAIVSGGAVDATRMEYVEARVLADELVRLGVPRERVIVEDRAMNTRENATRSQEIAKARGFQRLAMVTSAFHMRRARACFDKVRLPVDTLPVDYRTYSTDVYGGSWLPRSTHLDRSTAALREWSGFYVYRARGYVD